MPGEQGSRNRRTIDGVLAASAAAAVALGAVIARSAVEADEDVGQALATLLGWAPGLWRAVLVVTLALAIAVVVDAAVRRRWLLVRDLLVALLVVGSSFGFWFFVIVGPGPQLAPGL